MNTNYPKIRRSDSTIEILINSNNVAKKLGDIDLNLDINADTSEPIGIEIINLSEQLNSTQLNLESFEFLNKDSAWELNYDPKYDVGYIGYKPTQHIMAHTKCLKGAVLVDDEFHIVGFEIYD